MPKFAGSTSISNVKFRHVRAFIQGRIILETWIRGSFHTKCCNFTFEIIKPDEMKLDKTFSVNFSIQVRVQAISCFFFQVIKKVH